MRRSRIESFRCSRNPAKLRPGYSTSPRGHKAVFPVSGTVGHGGLLASKWQRGVFSSITHGDAVLRGYVGTDCSCILLVTSVISLTTGVDLTSDTWGLAKICPGGSDCRLTSSTMGSGIVGSDFFPATRGAFAGFAVDTKAACGPRCPAQSTTVLGGTGCTGPAFLFFVGGGCAIGDPNFLGDYPPQ